MTDEGLADLAGLINEVDINILKYVLLASVRHGKAAIPMEVLIDAIEFHEAVEQALS